MRIVLIVALVIGLGGPAWGGELEGVTMPDTVQVGGETLQLNGMGLRKKAVFNVYVAGLYLPEKMSDAEAILQADTGRQTRMEFHRRVKAKQMCGAWNDGLAANTANPSTPGVSSLDAAQICMPRQIPRVGRPSSSLRLRGST